MIFIVVANCAHITRAICQTPHFHDALLRSCPHTCGFCRRPGAGNRCPNTIKECDILVRLGGCNDARIRGLCQRSCNSLDCLTRKLFKTDFNENFGFTRYYLFTIKTKFFDW